MSNLHAILAHAILGSFSGWIAARAAKHFREGMGVGLIEPLRLILPNKKIWKNLRSNLADIKPSAETILTILLGAALFSVIGAVFPEPQRNWNLLFTALALIIAAVDRRQSFIPDTIVFMLIAAGFLRALYIYPSPLLFDAAAGLVAAYLIAALVQSLFDLKRQGAFFWGDLKLALALGVWLGFPNIAAAVFIASILGLVYGIAAYGIEGRKNPFPFAPFMTAGALFTMIFADDIETMILVNPYL